MREKRRKRKREKKKRLVQSGRVCLTRGLQTHDSHRISPPHASLSFSGVSLCAVCVQRVCALSHLDPSLPRTRICPRRTTTVVHTTECVCSRPMLAPFLALFLFFLFLFLPFFSFCFSPPCPIHPTLLLLLLKPGSNCPRIS